MPRSHGDSNDDEDIPKDSYFRSVGTVNTHQTIDTARHNYGINHIENRISALPTRRK
jgi:hypothetical protein